MKWTPVSFVAVAWRLLLATAGTTLAVGSAAAEYPERPITIVVPFSPGGTTDLLARILSDGLSKSLGVPVIVENKGGGGGNIGIKYVARAKPDGYTLLVSSSVFVVNPSLFRPSPYDPIKAFEPIVDLGASPNIIVAYGELGLSNLKEVQTYAKSHPNLNYATPGAGTTANLAGEIFKKASGVDMLHIPYPGAGPSTLAVMSGQTEFAACALSAIIDQIKAGKVRAIVQTGAEPFPGLSSVPTMKQAGLGDIVAETFQAFFAPANTPKPIIDLLARKSIEILQNPDTRAKLLATGFVVNAGGPEVLRARVAREVPLWRDVIEEAHIPYQ
jgi:tripartite-type tricarboxylate transporter receptor subunit TctC